MFVSQINIYIKTSKMKKEVDCIQVCKNNKLITVTRQDIPYGYQCVQSTHSIAYFAIEHREVFEKWHETSQYMVSLGAKNENHLKDLITKAEERDIKMSVFYEPDIGNEITSITLEPCETSRKMTSSLPKLMKELGWEVPVS